MLAEPRRYIAAGVAAAGAGVTGLAAGLGHTLAVAAVGVVVAGLTLAQRLGFGACAAVVLILTLDGVPGLYLQRYNASGRFRYTDILLASLWCLCAWSAARQPMTPRLRRLFCLLLVWAAVMLAVWLIGIHEAVSAGIPIFRAFLYGRDFLYWALLVPVTPFLVSNRSELRRFLLTLVLATVSYSIVLILATLGAVPAAFANPDHILASGSLTRVYTNMGDTNVIDVVFCCSLAGALLLRGRLAAYAAATMLITGTAIVLLLTRALWFGVLVGLVTTALAWTTRGRRAALLRRRFGIAIAVLLAAIISVSLLAPSALTTAARTTIVTRATQGFANVASATGTVGIRTSVTSIISSHIAGHWLLGVGFRDPTDYWVIGLPNGSLEDNDVSLLSSVSTMGIVGTLVLFMPVVVALRALVSRTGDDSEFGSVWMGATMWIVSGIASAFTLGFVETTYGIATGAVVLGVVARVMVIDADFREGLRGPLEPAIARGIALTVGGSHAGSRVM